MGQNSSRHQEAPQPPPQRPSRRRLRDLRPASTIFSSRQPELLERSSRRRHRISRLLPDVSHFSARDSHLFRPPSPPRRRTARLSRVRHAIANNTPGLSQHRISRINALSPSRHQNPSRNVSPDRASFRPSTPHTQEAEPSPAPAMSSESPEPTQPEPPLPSSHPRQAAGRSMTNRISSLTPARSNISRLNASIRRRRSRRDQAEDNAAMLTRLLSVAAAATAASLMGGNPETAVNDLRNTATQHVDSDDGTFDGFLQALRSGRLATHLGQNAGANTEGRDSTTASLDFFRMFRFQSPGAQQRARDRTSRSSSSRGRSTARSSSAEAQENDNEEGRMIPVLIVGIRALNNDQETRPEEGDAMPSFLDALQHFPTTINIGLSDQPVDGEDISRPRRGPLRFGNRRRASMGGLGLFSGAREGARRHGLSDRPRPRSEIGPPTASSTPPGPFAPPTTPSSPPLSSVPSGSTTPSQRARSSTPISEQSSNRDSLPSRAARTSVLDPTAEEPAVPRMTRQRRMSESDFMRHRSGSARRNGIVEPEHPPSDREGNRSWIIYVLGGSYPENHPILSTPSLFTDHPTYEDMLLLSSLLGSAKPPVATSEDLDIAGGLYTFTEVGERPLALAVEGEEVLAILPTEKCLVCLSDYQVEEVARKLKSCGHLFHRECIDQVS